MRRLAVLFIILNILPAVVLSILAWQTARSQQSILERQETQLRKQEVERASSRIRGTLLDAYRSFSQAATELAENINSGPLPSRFDTELNRKWAAGASGFVAQKDGTLLFPTAEIIGTDPRWMEFASWSREFLNTPTFNETLGSQPGGILGSPHQQNVKLIFWIHHPNQPDQILGAILDPRRLADTWKPLLEQSDTSPDISMAILDQTGVPVVRSAPLIRQPLSRPFASSPIGDSLPGWKVNLYLENPESLGKSAARLQAVIFGLIATAMLAIIFGGSLLLIEARRQRELALKKAHFVSNVTHELKTPLTSIKMFSEMLGHQADSLSEAQQRHLNIIQSETERLHRLIDQVLDFSKLEKRKFHYRKEEIPLHDWLLEWIDTRRPALESSGNKIRLTLPEEYPVIHADPDALTQILLNLLSNAEKYSPQESEIEVQLSTTPRDTHIDILDRGQGIPPGSEEKIFEPFHRADDALHSETQGTGLGLSLARGLARDHGGDIICRPRPGGGSIFSLHLPRLKKS